MGVSIESDLRYYSTKKVDRCLSKRPLLGLRSYAASYNKGMKGFDVYQLHSRPRRPSNLNMYLDNINVWGWQADR